MIVVEFPYGEENIEMETFPENPGPKKQKTENPGHRVMTETSSYLIKQGQK